MEDSAAEAKTRVPALIPAVEDGELAPINRNGRPVAQITLPPKKPHKVRFGGMKDRIRLLPGWDNPITEEELLGEEP
jgi:antitoxin (DNA-binding transcriptional repressor) of toxin-antitoxin stability system